MHLISGVLLAKKTGSIELIILGLITKIYSVVHLTIWYLAIIYMWYLYIASNIVYLSVGKTVCCGSIEGSTINIMYFNWYIW